MFDDLLIGNRSDIKDSEDTLSLLKNELKNEPTNTMKYRVLFRKIGRQEDNIRTANKQIGLINEEKKFWGNPELLDLKYGTNTHKIGAKGYKSGIGKKKGTPFDFFPTKDLSGYRGNAVTPKNSEGKGLVSLDEYEEKMNNLTIIDSSLGSQIGEGLQESLDTITKIWNGVFSDEDRNGVDVLEFRFGTKAIKKKHSVGGWSKRFTMQMEHLNDGKPVVREPSKIRILLNEEGDLTKDASQTMVHEMSHKRFDDLAKKDPKKMDRIIDKIVGLGREGSITAYAESYWDDLEKVKAENTDGSQEAKDNIREAERLIATEAHSEFMAGMTVPVLTNTYWKPRKENVMKLNSILKEEIYG